MNVFKLEVRCLRKSTLMATVSISVIILALLAFFPSMQTESMKALAGAKLESLDPAVLAAFGLTQIMDFTVLTNYFGYVLQYLVLAFLVLACQQAVALYSKEETDGTIEYLYSKPVSRGDIFWQKMLAHVAMLAAMLGVCAAATVAGYLAVSSYTFAAAVQEAAIFYSAAFFVSLVFTAVGLLLSVLIKSSRGAAGLALAIVFGSFLMGVLSLVVKQLSFLKWLSPMDWIKAQKLMEEGLTAGEWAVGAAVIVVCTLAAYLRYRKKDFLV